MSNSILSAPYFTVRSSVPRGVGSPGSHVNGHVNGHGNNHGSGARPVPASAPPLRRMNEADNCGGGQAVKLTRREIEVLTLVIEGNSSTEVADKLFVSKRTVDFHLANVYRKLSVKSRLQAYHEATRRGLLPGSSLNGGGLSSAAQ